MVNELNASVEIDHLLSVSSLSSDRISCFEKVVSYLMEVD